MKNWISNYKNQESCKIWAVVKLHFGIKKWEAFWKCKFHFKWLLLWFETVHSHDYDSHWGVVNFF